MVDEFDREQKYKLYRSLYEVIHPTISKKNISNYRIVLDEKLVPIHIFYPKKISVINSVVIYIHGISSITDTKKGYSNICKRIALKMNSLVIGIEYNSKTNTSAKNIIDECFNIVNYIYKNIEKYGIGKDKIILMGDSIGACIIECINNKDKKFKINNEVLFYPVLDLNKKTDDSVFKVLVNKINKYLKNKDEFISLDEIDIKNHPKTLIFTADKDPYKEDGEYLNKKLKETKTISSHINYEFMTHGFLNIEEDGFNDQVIKEINKFIKKGEKDGKEKN